MTASHGKLTAACDRTLVACEVASQRTIEWRVAAPEAARLEERAPLNLALVLDRSGSMQGDKLRYVQQAACHVLDQLGEQDRVAVITYDDEVTILAPSARLTEEARRGIKARIGALGAGGCTDLSGGWLTGCREVAAQTEEGGVSRALLLTDGLANRGITDSEELARHATELRRRGVATSTFGVGLGFNEHLLEALASQGGGRFFYIERPEEIPEVFRRELGDLLAVVAREAFLRLSVPRGVGVELLGDLPHERLGDRLRVFLGDLVAGEKRSLYTRVLTPPDAPGTSVVLRGELGYADLDGQARTAAAELSFAYVREAEALLAPVYRALLERAGEVELATAAARALKLEREGRRREAEQAVLSVVQATAAYAPAPAAARYTDLADRMARGMTEADRKHSQFAAYRRRQGREEE